ncbi:MAG: helix-turn-helix transcriptional regulator [Oscillospiraceae bacterium]
MNILKSNEPVVSNILKIIKNKGLKQCSIAEKAGYKSQDISNMINGRKIIKIADVLTFANVLDVSPNELFLTEQNN